MAKKVIKNLKIKLIGGKAQLIWDPEDTQWGTCCFQSERDFIKDIEKRGIAVEDCVSHCKLKDVDLTIDYNDKKCHLDDAIEAAEQEKAGVGVSE